MQIIQKIQDKKDRRANQKQNNIKPLPPGTAAPDFTLPSTTGKPIQLSQLHRRPVVLVFYPADNSPVCSNQLALYNQALPIFKRYNAAIFGISTDSPDSHKSFANNLNLAFPLLADNDPVGAIARTYGVFDEENQNSERALFVLDGSGIVQWSYVSPKNINPGADGILTALEKLS